MKALGRWLLGSLLAAWLGGAIAAPSYRDVVAAYRSSETVFTDRHGEVVQVLRTDPSVRKLAWTPLAEVSPALRAALVLSEDKRFFEHAGVDWQAIGAAAWGNVGSAKTRGASTITMQLAGLLDDDLRASNRGRSIGQKLSQAATALALERQWKKDEILEAYLNLVGYRGELVGIGALSATLFEKYPSGLDAREAAIAAALVRAPNAAAAKVGERACAILRTQGLPDECRGLAEYTTLVLARKVAPRLDSDPQLAPQFARAVAKARGRTTDGRPVATTLDASLQRFARATLRRHLAELVGRHVEDGAIVVLDNATGDVLAWVGSSGSLSESAEVDHVVAPRQAGSTLKPFLYELAIEKRWLTAASILDDTPVDLATTNGLYIPQNYDHDFKGPVTVRTALGSSLNVPAVRTLVMVTPERFHQRLRALGLQTLRESGDYYGYSLALGSAEVTLAQLTNAYRALANRGVVGPIGMLPRSATKTSVVMDAAASYIVSDMLADRNARAMTFGMDSVLDMRARVAVKTGTSKDMRDNWCVGYSGRYTVGVWVGNSSGASMWDVSGTTGAAPVWASVMRYLETGRSTGSDAANLPTGVVAARGDVFLAGTEGLPTGPRAVATHTTSRGATIVDGTVIAIDPDIPPGNQRVVLEAPASRRVPVRWYVDDRFVQQGQRIRWLPALGAHVVRAVDGGGVELLRVRLVVRGAFAKDSRVAVR